MTSHRPTRSLVLGPLAALALVAGGLVAGAAPAGAAEPITATGVELSASASCALGDIEVLYEADGVERQQAAFTAPGGVVLQSFEDEAFAPDHSGREYILTETATPPAPGTSLAVYVTIGTTPPQTATTAEFLVLYRCDATGNDAGGTNTVLATCFGDYGTCPRTADEAIAQLGSTSTTTATTATTVPAAPAAPPAVPVRARPRYTG